MLGLEAGLSDSKAGSYHALCPRKLNTSKVLLELNLNGLQGFCRR